MILCVRVQIIRAIGCRLLCAIYHDLLQTSSYFECCQLVSSFANALGVFVLLQTSEFHHVWSNESIAQASLCYRRPHLHYLVLIMLLLPLLRGFSNEYSFILIGVQTRELWPFYFCSCMLSRKFQNVQSSMIQPYPPV
jgi:hypothetical protein